MRRNLLIGLPLAAISVVQGVAQTRSVSGRVTDRTTGEGLPGVTVLLKGTSNGVSTNSDGTFTLSVPQEGGTLAISSVGYISVEKSIGSDSQINVGLSPDTKQLSEVVVTALGREQEKKGLGISVAEIKAEELVQARATNVVNSLAGKVAGVRVQASNGMVGSSSNIFIRGFTTFTGSNQPLFVIDGNPIDNSGGGNALQAGVSNSNRAVDINQDDIESVSILKGPAAAVLYGSRAASGAILITTKKGARAGAKGQTITVLSNYNVVRVGRLPEYQNIYGQGTGGAFNVLAQGSWGPRATGQTITNFRGEQEAFTISPDNVESIFKTGSNFQNNVSLSGATERTRYYASYGNLHEVGILDNNDLKRNTLTLNASANLTEKLRSGVNVIYTNSRSKRTPQGNQLSNPFFRSWFLPRTYDLRKYPFELSTNGGQQTLNSPGGTPNVNNTWYSNDDNPLWTIKNNVYNDEVNRVVGNASIAYDFTDWLSVDYRIGTDVSTQGYQLVSPRDSRANFIDNTLPSLVGTIREGTLNRRELNSYFNINLRRNITEDLGIRLLLGNEINQRRSTEVRVTGTDIQVRGFNNINNTLTYFPLGERFERRLIGVYGDLQLDYRKFAFLNLTGRNDWSSTFNPDKRSYFYPSASGSLVLSEAFSGLKDSKYFSLLKVRGAVAQVGREAPEYRTQTYYNPEGPADGFGPAIQFPFRGFTGQTFSSTAGNANLGPEFTTTYEVGTDIGLFNNRVTLEATYFNQRSRDIIFEVPVAGASGFTNIFQNIGKMESKGFEVLLNSTPVKIGSFTYSNSFNWSRIRNNVLSLAPGVDQITLGGFTTPSTRLIAGQPYGVIFGSVFQRAADGQLLVDANGRAQLALDNKIVGDPNPDWTGGITNTFTWKGLSLNTLLDIRYGGDIISRNVSDLRRQGAAEETADRDRLYVIKGVTADGRPNTTQIRAEDYFNDMYGFGRAEFVVFDASWLRLREVALTYALPKTLLDKTFIGGVELGINARNLFLYAPNVPHIDPEVNAQGVSNSQGLEFNALPQSRTYGASLRMTF
ncbi:SusC/RagA family TonB-linked outer membrane protein [Hymenobacter weizhouensis]|uniref:SusC/RagA family TonB-linked outer membrane protein n=1 Tax=Hymenobacter sp. YIM 151500-1 TaxID=2987689 RepID=UPI0022264717|nr:SusC/RagA family TonB-linked outer membrane protein [Hymenobacter sp. YIM 151500-1]UYZ63267.1 SusC/RagA family TonB-linked outer membrane protein [Hymenobacter sp. YIM 151500-1]